MAGKFAAVFVITALPQSRRFTALCALPLGSFVAWALFGATKGTTYGPLVFIFFTSMPLSWGWTLLYRYLEGRRYADILGAMVSASYVFGSGVAKTIGTDLINRGVDEYWMPLVASCVYIVPYFFFVLAVTGMPPPSTVERSLQGTRRPMAREEVNEFFAKYWPGILAILVSNMMLQSLRDYRDTFQIEIWEDLYPPENDEEETDPAIFTLTELPVSAAVLGALCGLSLVKSNRINIYVQHALFLLGSATLFLAQLGLDNDIIGGETWYVLVGIGIFINYAPIGAMFFDRLMGALQETGTAVLMITMVDVMGYTGTVILLLYKDLGSQSDSNPREFFGNFVFVSSPICALLTLISLQFWHRKMKKESLE